jgi:hypothetical protein
VSGSSPWTGPDRTGPVPAIAVAGALFKDGFSTPYPVAHGREIFCRAAVPINSTFSLDFSRRGFLELVREKLKKITVGAMRCTNRQINSLSWRLASRFSEQSCTAENHEAISSHLISAHFRASVHTQEMYVVQENASVHTQVAGSWALLANVKNVQSKQQITGRSSA